MSSVYLAVWNSDNIQNIGPSDSGPFFFVLFCASVNMMQKKTMDQR